MIDLLGGAFGRARATILSLAFIVLIIFGVVFIFLFVYSVAVTFLNPLFGTRFPIYDPIAVTGAVIDWVIDLIGPYLVLLFGETAAFMLQLLALIGYATIFLGVIVSLFAAMAAGTGNTAAVNALKAIALGFQTTGRDIVKDTTIMTRDTMTFVQDMINKWE